MKILTKHISCKCKCINDGRKYNSNKKNGIITNFGVSGKIKKNVMVVENVIFGILLHVALKMLNI